MPNPYFNSDQALYADDLSAGRAVVATEGAKLRHTYRRGNEAGRDGGDGEAAEFDVDLFRATAVEASGETMGVSSASGLPVHPDHGFFFKGMTHILEASYQQLRMPVARLGDFHPFFQTDFGYCSYIRPHVRIDLVQQWNLDID